MRAPSGFSGRLRKERAHQRLELLAAAAWALVLTALALADGQGLGDFLLAPLAVELVVGHAWSSVLPPGRYRSAGLSRGRPTQYTSSPRSRRGRRGPHCRRHRS